MRFVDRVRVLVRAGNGGRGHVGWRREKFVPRGGPAGGDGGKGGDVIFVADESLTTLLDLRYQQHYQAEHGKPGRNKMQNGPSGEDRRIRVPVGTMVYLEGVAGEPGERPPWLEGGGDVEDEGDLETIYVFEDELEGDEEDAVEAEAEAGEAGGAEAVSGECEASEAEADMDDAEAEADV
ncbi:MAG: hypothetical protein KC420_19020, partial [Myxococcales bacterium]|nr:hypothetical protein [Myxococcales bacterium]